jgi:hypothetical protein
MNNLNVTAMHPSLFTVKGNAAPSPAINAAEIQAFPTGRVIEPDANADVKPVNGLAGLIKRANAIQPGPMPPVEPVRLQALEKPDVVPSPAQPVEAKKPAQPRRQMTVRVDMEKFQHLDMLAKMSGRTYQDIQAKAIDAYLTANSPIALLN